MVKTKLLLIITLFFLGFTTLCNSQTDTLRIMTYNLRAWDFGEQQLIKASELINIYNPDLIGLQEVDSLLVRGATSNRDGSPTNMIDSLLHRTVMKYGYFAGLGIIKRGKPYRYGDGVLVKEEPIRKELIYLPVSDGIDSTYNQSYTGLHILEYPKFVFFNTHLNWADPKSRILQANEIKKIAEKYDKPIFLTGDMNAAPTWRADVIPVLLEYWEPLNSLNTYTFPADKPSRTIDYIFYYKNPKFHIYPIYREVINNNIISDHKPVVVDVVF